MLLPVSPASATRPGPCGHAKPDVPPSRSASERRTAALAGLASPRPAGPSSATAGCDLLSAPAKTTNDSGGQCWDDAK
ncbi:hypothetical protein CG436_09250 [Pantoea ananatis]|nr:hypothetical protein CG432_13075 [Pantoea ananatis]PQL07164.1 hypothetical protein CG436_09250 [Pantoea ananatis]QAB31509.1 hypothetical protein EPK90_17775 [Pantoea ananatis]